VERKENAKTRKGRRHVQREPFSSSFPAIRTARHPAHVKSFMPGCGAYAGCVCVCVYFGNGKKACDHVLPGDESATPHHSLLSMRSNSYGQDGFADVLSTMLLIAVLDFSAIFSVTSVKRKAQLMDYFVRKLPMVSGPT